MKKILFIILSLLIVIWGGVYFIVSQENKNLWDIQYSQSPNIEKALTYQELREQMEEKNAKNVELYNMAIKEKDPRICEEITEISKKNECKDAIVASIAQKNNNLEQCSTLSNTGILVLCKDAIYTDRAIMSNDTWLCKEISSTTKQASCIDLIDIKKLQEATKDKKITEEFCETLISEKQKSTCLASVSASDETSLYQRAITEDDINICKKIETQDTQITCIDTISLKLAISSSNITLCEDITDESKKAYCKMQLSRNSDIWIYKTSIQNNTLDACQNIENENLRNKCHDTIILNTVKIDKDVSRCDNINDTTIISACKQIWQ